MPRPLGAFAFACCARAITWCVPLVLAVPAAAEICKYVDRDGNMHYTNVAPEKGWKKLSCGVGGSTAPGEKAAKAASPAGFPKVDTGTQKGRDDLRRKVLTEELATEEKLLAEARVALAEFLKAKPATTIASLRAAARSKEPEFAAQQEQLFRGLRLAGYASDTYCSAEDYLSHSRHDAACLIIDVQLPGMTGLWQVSGRSELDFDDLVRLDFLYLERWSVFLDLSILLRTVPAVLSRRGAF